MTVLLKLVMNGQSRLVASGIDFWTSSSSGQRGTGTGTASQDHFRHHNSSHNNDSHSAVHPFRQFQLQNFVLTTEAFEFVVSAERHRIPVRACDRRQYHDGQRCARWASSCWPLLFSCHLSLRCRFLATACGRVIMAISNCSAMVRAPL